MAFERVDSIPILPKRPSDGHKGLFGTVLVLAGGRGMAGAAALAGASALRSGAGLVRVATAAEVQPTVATFEPCYMTYPIANDEDGYIKLEAGKKALAKWEEHASVLAVGPGLGQSEDLKALVRWILESIKLPTILDADALNAIGSETGLLSGKGKRLVITPHPGEFARLSGLSIADIQADRETHAAEFAAKHELVVVLKGAKTVVTDGSRLYVNKTGNPGMATGGSGDVLTGVIAALIAQKLPPLEAAVLGVYVHGLAGDISRDQNGEVGMIAGDIVDSLPDAFYHLSS
ncbi:NAD(P)H-hydrate dehydratase [Singulisphaera sp. PoT]|uniref:NAD(P)H-hydrate dehydratase n=1 Tax=Singulisphaera sp. PoT TaxID=3411797 RepID=UPI003BF4F448